ncbi:hypothetical protein J6590_101653 [Homalodisca vitripennis]|nr:hypothetical protein J6590_101653 [Homalodisca vitripennis]
MFSSVFTRFGRPPSFLGSVDPVACTFVIQFLKVFSIRYTVMTSQTKPPTKCPLRRHYTIVHFMVTTNNTRAPHAATKCGERNWWRESGDGGAPPDKYR